MKQTKQVLYKAIYHAFRKKKYSNAFLSILFPTLCVALVISATLNFYSHTTKKAVPAKQRSGEDTRAHSLKHLTDPNTDQSHWKELIIQKGDNPIKLFKQLRIDISVLHDILSLKAAYPLSMPIPGKKLKVLLDEKHQLLALVYVISSVSELWVQKDSDQFVARIHHNVLKQHIEYRQATIHHSLFAAANRVGIDDGLATQLMKIFGWDIDFAKDIRPGDVFRVLYNTYWFEGHKIKNGEIIAVQFNTNKKVYQAIRYTNPEGETDYYTPKGLNLKRAFLRNPVKYTRISSYFQLHRKHPILHHIRAHKGVDYAAPLGTPIHATANGKIAFINKKGGYGNAIIIKHGTKYSTLYGHLYRFAKGLHRYANVRQGQIIGYVGQTGLATGPHLHYEFRIHGVHRNPLTVKLPQATPIPKPYLKDFIAYAKAVMLTFDQQNMLATMGAHLHEGAVTNE